MINLRDYKLRKGLTEKQLANNGFRGGKFRCWIYKNLIQLQIEVDLEDSWWTYRICDANTDRLYSSYYDREYGVNRVVEEIDKTFEKIMDEMITAKIFYKRGDKRTNGKRNRKVLQS